MPIVEKWIQGYQIFPNSIPLDRVQGLVVSRPKTNRPPDREGDNPYDYTMPPPAFNVDLIVENSLNAIKLEAGTITGREIADHALEAIKLQIGTITSEYLAADSVYAAALQDGAVDLGSAVCTGFLAADRIAAGTLAAGVIYAGTIGTDQLVAGSALIGDALIGNISASHITSGTISANVVYAGTIGTDQLVAGSALIGDALIGNVSANKITAGTISANLLLSGSIATGSSGPRVVIRDDDVTNAYLLFYTPSLYESAPAYIGVDTDDVQVASSLRIMGPKQTSYSGYEKHYLDLRALGIRASTTLVTCRSEIKMEGEDDGTEWLGELKISSGDAYIKLSDSDTTDATIDMSASNITCDELTSDTFLVATSYVQAGSYIKVDAGTSDDKLIFGSHAMIKYCNASGALELARNSADNGWITARTNILDVLTHVSLFNSGYYCALSFDYTNKRLVAIYSGTTKILAQW